MTFEIRRTPTTRSVMMWRRNLTGFCVCVMMLAGCASTARTDIDPRLSGVAWMAGRWVNEQGGTYSEERWTEPRGGTMLGVNRTIVDGKTISFEYLRIEAVGDRITYYARPKGSESETAFRLAQDDHCMSEQRAVFLNDQHDFPQSIIYEREGKVLHAYAGGLQNGRLRREQWAWKRAGD